MDIKAKPWNDLTHFKTPQWLKDAKYGIYTHWGVYSVAAYGPNVSWYPHCMYQEGTEQYEYHCKKFGHPSKVGYKDLIPKFDGSKFDADEWAEIFAGSGAKFAGPVAEHHDGFTLWDSALTKWNAKLMGPKRDVVGEQGKAFRKKGMKFLAALHHGLNWRFYPHWVKEYDTSNPEYTGLYGELHNVDWGSDKRYSPQRGFDMYSQDLPTRSSQDLWLAKCVEVIDKYSPDFLWMENDLEFIGDYYKRAFLTYSFDKAAERKQELVVSYKRQNLPPGSGLVDWEQGHLEDLTYYDWITDTTIDSGTAWGYMEGAGYKSGRSLIHYLIDNVSKNGYLLLNIGPKPNGEIPEEAKTTLKEMGAWLSVNGEAIYGTMPWVSAGAGPTVMKTYGEMSELHDAAYQPSDIRFTLKNDVLYAVCLGEINDRVVIPNIGGQFYREYLGRIKNISLLGDGHDLNWKKEGVDIVINTTGVKVQRNANVLKIQREPSDYR